jgi:O-methyltransferase
MRKYVAWPSPKVLAPWAGDEKFTALHTHAIGRTLVTIDRCYVLYALAEHAATLPGSMAECGVYKGGTASILAGVASGKAKLYLFDTFTGIPPGQPGKDNRYINGGEFSETSKEEVEAFIGAPPTLVEIRAGLVPETLFGLTKETFSFVHLDLDIYRPILESLTFFHSRLIPGGIILVDDYGFEECQGALNAVEEFSAWAGIRHVPLPTGQAMFIGR